MTRKLIVNSVRFGMRREPHAHECGGSVLQGRGNVCRVATEPPRKRHSFDDLSLGALRCGVSDFNHMPNNMAGLGWKAR